MCFYGLDLFYFPQKLSNHIQTSSFSPPPLSRKLCADHYTIILLTNDTNLPRVLSVAFFSLIRGNHAWHRELVALPLNIVHKMSPCVVFGSPDTNIMCKWELIINNIWQGLCDTCSELSKRTTGPDQTNEDKNCVKAGCLFKITSQYSS